MNTFYKHELNKLTDLQEAFLLLIIEKYTGNKYSDLLFLRKDVLVAMLNDVSDKITKKGLKQLQNITKKLKL
jgi:hypothetical protein